MHWKIFTKPDSKYITQMTWQMACTGRKWCEFVSFDPRMPAKHRLFVVRYEPTDLEKYNEAAALFLADVADTIERLEKVAA